MHLVIHTQTVVVLKEDVNTIDAVNPTKIHLPPYGLVFESTGCSYYFCPHIRPYVPVHSVTGYIGDIRTVRGCR